MSGSQKDGTSVGLFIPLPQHIGDLFPKKPEDPSPCHTTFLIVGDVRGREDVFLEIVRHNFADLNHPITAKLGVSPDYFLHPTKDQKVFYMPVRFSDNFTSYRWKLVMALWDAGFEVSDYNPGTWFSHATLGYMPGVHSEWAGVVPQGSWDFNSIEVWGLPEKTALPFGKQATKTPAEKEDQDARELIKKPPSKKPPRQDLRRHRVRNDDPDVEKPGADNDKDLSKNYKKVGGKVKQDKHPKDPGDFWETDNGWGAQSPKGEYSGGNTQEAAEAWAAGGAGQPAPPKAPAPAKKKPAPDPIKEFITAQVSEKHLTDAFPSVFNTVGGDKERKKLIADVHQILSGHLKAMEGGLTEDVLKSAEKAMSKDVKFSYKPKSHSKIASQLADRMFAEKVLCSPEQALGGLREGTEGLAEQKEKALAFYEKFTPKLQKKVAEVFADRLEKLPPGEERDQIEGALDAFEIAVAAQGGDIGDLREEKSSSFKVLAKHLTAKGNASLLLKDVGEQDNKEGRAKIAEAMAEMGDEDLHEMAGGDDGPMAPLSKLLTDTDEWGIAKLDPDRKDSVRELIQVLMLDEMTTIDAFLTELRKHSKKNKDKPKVEEVPKTDEIKKKVLSSKEAKVKISEWAKCIQEASTTEEQESCNTKAQLSQLALYFDEFKDSLPPDNPERLLFQKALDKGDPTIMGQKVVKRKKASLRSFGYNSSNSGHVGATMKKISGLEVLRITKLVDKVASVIEANASHLGLGPEMVRKFASICDQISDQSERFAGFEPDETEETEDKTAGFGYNRSQSYGGDPRWIKAKYPGVDKSGNPFKRGDEVLYWPVTKTLMAGKEADAAWQQFLSEKGDEEGNPYARAASTGKQAADERAEFIKGWKAWCRHGERSKVRGPAQAGFDKAQDYADAGKDPSSGDADDAADEYMEDEERNAHVVSKKAAAPVRDLSKVKPSSLKFTPESAMGHKWVRLYVDNQPTGAQFEEMSRGYTALFWLRDAEGTSWHFPKEAPMAKNIANFKQGLKEGFVFLQAFK
jgi:hypothetical protein